MADRTIIVAVIGGLKRMRSMCASCQCRWSVAGWAPGLPTPAPAHFVGLDVVALDVGGRADHEHVAADAGHERTRHDAGDLLVDVEVGGRRIVKALRRCSKAKGLVWGPASYAARQRALVVWECTTCSMGAVSHKLRWRHTRAIKWTYIRRLLCLGVGCCAY